MQRYELGAWIFIAAAALAACGSSTDTSVGSSKDGGVGGSLCTANSACVSGLCLAGVCASGKPGGGTCTTASDCVSGACQAGACVGNGQGVPASGTCTSNAECASGVCSSGTCAAGSGLSDGRSCSSATECASAACTNGVCGTGTGIAGGTGGAAAGTGGAAAGTGGAVAIVDGGKATYGSTQCTDGIDNDGDGKIDAADPECTGPLDNDESSFATGIPGDNVDPKWQDCFFDGNSGGGDDGCRYASGCLTGALPQTDPSCITTTQCHDYCKKFVPNGCDCFGCCAVEVPDGGTKNIFIQSSCTMADINDPTKCPTCVQSADCVNTCQRCELCVGKDTVPADCAPAPATGGAGGTANTGGATSAGGTSGAGGAGGTVNTGGTGGAPCPAPLCPATQQPCGVSCLPACPATEYCLTGCCVPSIR